MFIELLRQKIIKLKKWKALIQRKVKKKKTKIQ